MEKKMEKNEQPFIANMTANKYENDAVIGWLE